MNQADFRRNGVTNLKVAAAAELACDEIAAAKIILGLSGGFAAAPSDGLIVAVAQLISTNYVALVGK